ncbi:MAG TPA: IS1182 family transposase [Gemmataceae bacterium]|jgi:transposase|nr:IS1182 family transposase [Gemmataceae bacterium]
MTAPLFEPGDLPELPSPAQVAQPALRGQPRLRVPVRDQVEFRWASLDELLDPNHPVRAVWAAVCSLRLDAWLDEIKAVEHHVGRDATDPRLLLALWVYATVKGIGSARELARLCFESVPFQWLCGSVTVNYHTLADFRSHGEDKWDALLTDIVAALMAEGLVDMECVAQDGMRVRASAGKSSFRRRERLEQFREEARQQVETLKRLAEEDSHELTQRQLAARQRAAQERQERIEEALRQCAELQEQREATAQKSGRKADEARASTTDAEARNMKFPDGGFRPGYNFEYATEAKNRFIVGADVTGAGTDGNELVPMLDQLQERYERVPPAALVDGGFATVAAIEGAAARGCTVYAPLKDEQKQLAAGKDPHAAKKGDSVAVAAWRTRMGTEAAKAIYQLRCQTAEWVNAQCRNRGLWMVRVRGRAKVRIVSLLYAIAHNLTVAARLRAEAAPGVV